LTILNQLIFLPGSFVNLYRKYIFPGDRNLWNIAMDEAVYRLDENKKMNCSCIEHLEEREKLEKFLRNFPSKE